MHAADFFGVRQGLNCRSLVSNNFFAGYECDKR